eukprot:CAMPEP_0185793408 /NCGR_PEP_ID=MMETSP1174-20130828/159455_1 /TAXON_ID=35687 /ORGANISM="Dictyocha speculum, Strain CCMP1381" /LENGTH=106 /DNA_ID=CAMNT_0028488545 /DNA_START=152 /DNA_END=472 /DNA_ORIENTATION=+
MNGKDSSLFPFREGLIERTPALAEILESPVRGRLLEQVNHVVDDKKAVEFLDALPGDIAILRTAMAAGATHLDAIGTSDSELLPQTQREGIPRSSGGCSAADAACA